MPIVPCLWDQRGPAMTLGPSWDLHSEEQQERAEVEPCKAGKGKRNAFHLTSLKENA